MAKLNDLSKRVQAVQEQLEQYNKLNNDLKRFAIFNTFHVNYEFDGPFLTIEGIFADDVENNEEINLTRELSQDDDTMLKLDLQNPKETAWILRMIARLILRTQESIDKARQLAKPQVGILIYDEYSDTYLLNPTTGKILLKSKEIAKEISKTRMDMFGILFNLREIIIDSDYLGEIIGQSADTVEKTIIEKIFRMNGIATKLSKIEGIPRWVIKSKTSNLMFELEGYITDSTPLEVENTKLNYISKTYDLTKPSELDELYNFIRKSEELNTKMAELAKILVTKNDPKLYTQNQETKIWQYTSEGKELMKNMNIVEFLNEDLEDINIDLL